MLIIYAHPNKTGNCGEILKNVIEELNQQKVSFKLIDLYEINYDPILNNSELYSAGNHEISEQNKLFQKQILENNKFIFIYPTWWNNMPAILKGFIDRVFTSNFGFKYVRGIPCGLLNGRALVFTSTGASKFLYYIFLGGRSLKILTKDSLKFCGLKTKGYVIGKATELDEKQKIKIKKIVKNGLKFLS